MCPFNRGGSGAESSTKSTLGRSVWEGFSFNMFLSLARDRAGYVSMLRQHKSEACEETDQDRTCGVCRSQPSILKQQWIRAMPPSQVGMLVVLDLVPSSFSEEQNILQHNSFAGGNLMALSFLRCLREFIFIKKKKKTAQKNPKKKPQKEFKTGNSYQLARKLYCSVEVLLDGHCYIQ